MNKLSKKFLDYASKHNNFLKCNDGHLNLLHSNTILQLGHNFVSWIYCSHGHTHFKSFTLKPLLRRITLLILDISILWTKDPIVWRGATRNIPMIIIQYSRFIIGARQISLIEIITPTLRPRWILHRYFLQAFFLI